MSLRNADPTRTYALLVGVEKYDAGAEWNKLSVLRDILDFHAWLRLRGVPADQIQTLFSPRDESAPILAQSKVLAMSATSENARKAFDSLHDKRGDLLFVFWGGHGALHQKQHRLFLADATLSNKRNINFDALRESLASTYFKGFALQILIVDACATYENYPFSFPSEPIPCGEPLTQNAQFVFFAAAAGQPAKSLGEEKRGLLSRELLKQIRNLNGKSWPPDMLALARRVQEEFVLLRASADFDQTPVYELSEDWDGNKIELKGPMQRPGEQAVRDAWKLSAQQLIALTDALSNMSRMSTSAGRDLMLAQMRSEISGAVPRASDTTSDVMNILRTAANYPAGLEEVLWFIHHFEGETLSWRAVTKVVAERFPNLKMPSSRSPAPIAELGAAKLDLVEALAECPTLAEKAGRDLCVGLLDDPIPSKINRQDDRRADLLNIVSACLEHAGGIEGLVAAVEAREKNSVHMPRVLERAAMLKKAVERDDG